MELKDTQVSLQRGSESSDPTLCLTSTRWRKLEQFQQHGHEMLTYFRLIYLNMKKAAERLGCGARP